MKLICFSLCSIKQINIIWESPEEYENVKSMRKLSYQKTTAYMHLTLIVVNVF